MVGKMFRLQSKGPRSTLEEMLDMFKTNDVQEMESINEEEARPPPLPVRPTSRARLPSSVRTKKVGAQTKVANGVVQVEDRSALQGGAKDQVSAAPASPEGARTMTMSKLEGSKTPSGISFERPNGFKGRLEKARSRRDSFDDKTPNGNVGAGSVRPGLSVLPPEQTAFSPMPNSQNPPLTPPLTPPRTPPPEMLSPFRGSKKWRADGVLPLRKVRVSPLSLSFGTGSKLIT